MESDQTEQRTFYEIINAWYILEMKRKNGYIRTNMYVLVHILKIERFKEDCCHAYKTTENINTEYK